LVRPTANKDPEPRSNETDLAPHTTHLVLAYRSLQKTLANIIESMRVRFWERYLTRNRCLPLFSDVESSAANHPIRLQSDYNPDAYISIQSGL
jgi:hypothetical protein